MLRDSTIRKSLDDYIKSRIREIPMEVSQTFPDVQKVWKFGSVKASWTFCMDIMLGRLKKGRFAIC